MSRYGAQRRRERRGCWRRPGSDSTKRNIWIPRQCRQWLVNKLPLLDCDGEIENIVTVALDIGERKRGELEMRKAKDAAEAALRNLPRTRFADRGGKARRTRAAGGGRRPRVNNPVGISLRSLRRGAQDGLFARGRARQSQALQPE